MGNPVIPDGADCYRALRHPWHARRYQSLMCAYRLPSLSRYRGNRVRLQTVAACPCRITPQTAGHEPAFDA